MKTRLGWRPDKTIQDYVPISDDLGMLIQKHYSSVLKRHSNFFFTLSDMKYLMLLKTSNVFPDAEVLISAVQQYKKIKVSILREKNAD